MGSCLIWFCTSLLIHCFWYLNLTVFSTLFIELNVEASRKTTLELTSVNSVEITNKMQPCNRIYYSKVYWRLNMFRAAYRSLSGALNCICSLWFTYTCGDWPLSSLSGKWTHFPLRLDNCRSPHVYVNQRLQIQFRAPDDERYDARTMLSLQ